ncbi:Na+/H+ antiporter [Streptomyces fractus]|uniref:Na+/H+ antiporter n=1 Tax=Streptomyces fractus TaxID=641806 RepID=UPI003CF144A6
MGGITTVVLLVMLGTAVATGARHWSVPAPSLLVVAGVLVGLVPFVPDLHVPPELISTVVLPPLLYASATEIPWRELRRMWRPVTVLVLGLVLMTAFAIGAVAVWLTPMGAATAFVLGAVLASTDPVAVTALGRKLPLPPRVQILVQSESLFNDASSLVLFKVAIGMAVAGGAVSLPAAGGEFLLLAGGGAAVGAAVAGVVALLRSRTEDPVLETVIALVTPYASYVVGEQLHTSGVTAVVVCGVMLGSLGHRLTSPRIRLQVHAVYDIVVFILESAVFAVIGLELPSLVAGLKADEGGWWWQALVLAAVAVAARMLWVFPLSAAMQKRRGATTLSWRVPAVMAWAGTRGVMPLAAALSIPYVTDDGSPLPYRELVLVLTTAVVVITLVGQGFTLGTVVRRSGIALEPADTAKEEAEALALISMAGLARLRETTGVGPQDSADDDEVVVEQIRRALEARLAHAESGPDAPTGPTPLDRYRTLRRDVLAAETAELQHLYVTGKVPDAVRQRILHALDLEEATLGA